MWTKVDNLRGEIALGFASSAIDPICRIAADKEAADIFYSGRPDDGESAEAFTERRMRTCIPLLMKNHMDSLVEILAANQGISVEDYTGSASFLSMSADIASMISDAGFILFFNFAQTRISSGSAPVNTMGRSPSGRSEGTVRPVRQKKRKKRHGGNM